MSAKHPLQFGCPLCNGDVDVYGETDHVLVTCSNNNCNDGTGRRWSKHFRDEKANPDFRRVYWPEHAGYRLLSKWDRRFERGLTAVVAFWIGTILVAWILTPPHASVKVRSCMDVRDILARDGGSGCLVCAGSENGGECDFCDDAWRSSITRISIMQACRAAILDGGCR